MATQLQIRRGTTAQMNAFTGAEGELAVNTTTDTVHVHDGSTAGGFALAKADGSNIGTYAGSFTTLAASGAVTLSSTLAVTGTATMDGLALTGDITQSAAGARVTTSTTTGNGGIQNNNGTAYHLNFGSSHASEASNVWINSTGGSVKIKNAGNDVAVFDSTGIDVTGTVTATKLVSANGVLELDDNGSHNGVINVPASLFINIDSDNGATGEDFVIAKDRTGTSGGTELFRVQEDGNLLVGCTSVPTGGSSTGFSISDNGGMQMVTHGVSGTGNTYVNIYKNANGTVGGIRVSGSQTFFDGSSDQRLKDNIVDAPSASEDIDAIQVRSFNWKADNEYQKYGMIAQELATVAPIAVYQPEDPEEMQAVDYSKLVPMMLKEIQSLRSRVAELENN